MRWLDTSPRRRLAERLRRLRLERRLTQEQLAELAHFHPTYIQKVEAARISPSLEALVRLATALHVPVASLVAAVDEPGDAWELAGEVAHLVRGLPDEWQRFVKAFVQFLLTNPEPERLRPRPAVGGRSTEGRGQ